jgi:TPR repeat protein
MNCQGASVNGLEPVKYLRHSAKGNNVQGRVLLGICADFGIGCSIDQRESAELFRMAAGAGNAQAQFSYSVIVVAKADHILIYGKHRDISKCQRVKVSLPGR